MLVIQACFGVKPLVIQDSSKPVVVDAFAKMHVESLDFAKTTTIKRLLTALGVC